MFEIKLTKLGQTMEEGEVAEWLIAVGDSFKEGDVLYECETEKARTEVEATRSGKLVEIVVAENEIVPVGTVIARAEEA
ncbi:biotin/lipoyl-containing protein [Maricaulis salignorans]|uniref:Biotin-requiring enzyme n=1 Tax=Maricaulis salignorans TaxID=144026 RepID=A0A1G9LSL6_9PROT|nr:biotin/lipoyl-containing protein [Maricaulis salignorans]SDL64764.1 Biotin-requiring enzyme [Maricaulis salignorans]